VKSEKTQPPTDLLPQKHKLTACRRLQKRNVPSARLTNPGKSKLSNFYKTKTKKGNLMVKTVKRVARLWSPTRLQK
jgi:hypothetical protein